MSFNQFKLDIASVQTRGIFNTYVYQTETDTTADVQAAGYFAQSRFELVDGDGCGALIRCCCSNGFFEGFVDASGTIDPIDNISSPVWPPFRIVSSDEPLQGEIDCIAVDCTSGDITITLPVLGAGNYNVKKIDSSANVVILNASTNGSTLDGQPTRNITGQWDNVTINSSSAEWYRQ